MHIRMQATKQPNDLRHLGWKAAIIGEAVDERGNAAAKYVARHTKSIFNGNFDSDELEIKIDDDRLSTVKLEEFIQQIGPSNFLLEATTLGLTEIFLVCKAAKNVGSSGFSLLYIEPTAYSGSRRKLVLHRRDFELSDEVRDFSGIPGAALMLRDEKVRVVFLVGYEGQRLEQALEQTNVKPSDCCIVFGLPAFHPGWELDSFANNIRVLKDRQISDLMYTGAQNVAGAYETLQRVKKSCAIDQRMLVSPIGTKPHGIAAALFACEQEDVGLLYDHPIKAKGRSSSVEMWHLFDISFDDI